MEVSMSVSGKLPTYRPGDQIVSEAEIEELGLEIAPDDIGPPDDDTDDDTAADDDGETANG
jgi:hypothetical protein